MFVSASPPNRICIVDDQMSVLLQLKAMLKQEEYDIHLLQSGRQLLDNLATLNPDLILLDVMMPDLDGFEVCWHIKSNPQFQHIPIILVTSLDGKEALSQGMEAGADDFVPKPPSQLELRARVRSMLRIKRQYDELEGMLKIREELSNMIVHDMSSPITSILLHTTLIEQALEETEFFKEDKELAKNLNMVKIEADRLDSFVNDMLMLAKMEASKLRVNPTLVNLNQLALNAEQHFSIIAKSRNIQLKLELPKNQLQIIVDRQLYNRVIANLLANALKYSPADTTVTLRLEEMPADNNKTHARLKVLDQGVGIPKEYRERIFQKFEVIDLKNKGITQTGLGLTFCKMVVDAHNGIIYVEDNEPKGSIFIVEI